MFYITGDTNGDFNRIYDFCSKNKTSRADVLIILGDAGINCGSIERDRVKKIFLSKLPITLFCIHGDHEQRPSGIESYEEDIFCSGTIYKEKQYPNILFAKDGEIFDFNGCKTIVIGGAYSLDKNTGALSRYGWWSDAEPSGKIKKYVESQLGSIGWKVDVVLTHTTPFKYEPLEIIPEKTVAEMTNATEKWLGTIEERLNYKKWYCGHFQTEKKVDKLEIMYQNFDVFFSKY